MTQLIDLSPRAQTVRTLLRNTGIQETLDLPGVTEVAVNQCGRIFREGDNGWEYRDEPAASLKNLTALASALSVYSNAGLALDSKNPVCSVVLPGGERGQVLIAPATETGHVSLTIRKPSVTRFTLDSYAASGRLSGFRQASKTTDPSQTDSLLALYNKGDLLAFFQEAVLRRLNILLVGGTGSGKTTFMKALADLFPHDRRIFTIEDVHELALPYHLNHLHLFYREGGMTPKRIIESCMRMKPDHVFLAELRGDETLHYFELLNTGHAGSLTTTHANSCRDAFTRLSDLIKQSPTGQHLDYDFILRLVRRSLDVVCYMERGYIKEILFEPQEKAALNNG